MINNANEFELEGEVVKLIPLKEKHKDDLLVAAEDGKLWELWYTSVPSKDSIDDYINTAIEERAANQSVPFVIINKSTNTIIGSTRYCFMDAENRRVEIGYTWYAKSFQRTGVNTECKYLLLKYAFEKMKCIAVVFKTNWFNMASRRAIERLGAKQDGVLRNHKLNLDGTYRDSVIFSIIEQEWSSVKKTLEYEMQKHREKS